MARTTELEPGTGAAGDYSVAFELSDGLRDARGHHRAGRMRPARVGDELRGLRDFRVYLRPDAFLRVMLARTVSPFGEHARLDAGMIDRLSERDRRQLEALYAELNGYDDRGGDGGVTDDGSRGDGTVP